MKQYELKVAIEEYFANSIDGVVSKVFFDTDDNEYKKGIYLKYIGQTPKLVELGVGKEGFDIVATLRITILSDMPTNVFKLMGELEGVINYKTLNKVYYVESFVGGSTFKVDNSGLYQGFVDYSVRLCQ